MRTTPQTGVFHQPPNRLGASAAQTGRTAGAGLHAGGRDSVAAGGTIEPITAVFALNFRKPLVLFALRALPVHFPVGDIFFEYQAAAGAFGRIPFAYFAAAILHGADEDRFTGAAPVFPFFHFLANRAFFHGHGKPHRNYTKISPDKNWNFTMQLSKTQEAEEKRYP